MKVKICGIRTFEEARAAVEAGADMLGFNFYPPSPRYISPGDCLALLNHLRQSMGEQMAQVTLVGVFVNAPADLIRSLLRDGPLDLAQLSGDEPPEVLAELGDRAFKALRPSSPGALDEAVARYPGRPFAPYWLVDAYRPGEYGGTGQTANWSLAARLAAQSPILLAGGLRPDNVAQAVRQVRPWGVDVASGVEASPGVKDPRKVRDFITAVRLVEKEFV